MRITPGVRLAYRGMARHRMRALFMMLGITVGISSLTALYSVGENTRQETTRRFKNMLGTFDTVMVRPGSGRTRGMPSLTNVDPTLKFDDAIDVKYKDRATATAVFGASPNWLDLRGDEVGEGAFLSDEDEGSLARVAVIGTDVQAALFGGEVPEGKTFRIGEVPFQVKGVLKSRGAGPAGASLDNVIMIPLATASKRLFNRDFLTMLVGGVVIMSLMLIAVSERRKEIGVRRSFGASRQDILQQFMLEALVISGLGGLLGVAIGLAGTNIVANFEKLPPIFAWNALGLAAGLSVGTGFLFGLYPAWKAARVDPVIALRL